MDSKTVCFLFAFIGVAVAVADPEIDIQQSLQNLNINGVPNDLDLTNITNAVNPEQVEDELRKKCRERSGGEEAYEKAKQTMLDTKTCIENILNYEKIQEEIELAKPTGDLDVVFKKYCMQTPTIKKCIYDAANSMEPCLQAEEVDTKNTGINVTDSLIDFICHKDGDRIALFIAEGGPDCLNASLPAMQVCVKDIFNLTVGGELPSMESLPLLMLNTEDCGKFVALQKCIVKKMDDCPETTPGNVVESLFNFVKKHTPCKNYQSPLTDGKGAADAIYSPLTVLLSVTLAAATTFLLNH